MSKTSTNTDGMLTDEQRAAFRQLRTDIEDNLLTMDEPARVKALGQYGTITAALAKDLKAQHTARVNEERAEGRAAEGTANQYVAPDGEVVTVEVGEAKPEFAAPTPPPPYAEK